MAALDAIRQGAPNAGLGAGYSGHSGRVGLAVRMTAKGAPTHAVTHRRRRGPLPLIARRRRDCRADISQRGNRVGRCEPCQAAGSHKVGLCAG